MARARRRSTRANTRKSTSPFTSGSNTPTVEEANESHALHVDDDRCPACTDGLNQMLNASDKESWIRCDVCKVWYHWRCAGNGGDVDAIDKWFCSSCLAADPTKQITFKAPARKSSRKRTQRDYASLNSGLGSDPTRWLRMLEGKVIKENRFKRMQGSEVGLDWLDEDQQALTEPIIIEGPEGLGMKMPSPDFTVDKVAEFVGKETPVEVIDVASQSTSPGWNLGKWVDYFNLEPSARDKILNVISLEVSETKLSDMIFPPRLVRELDWVENFWPSTRKGKGHAYPKVQLYCLMGVANAWTDWHIDFAGSSVYYHIVRGSKVFYFIRPTPANLAAYQRWSGTDIQNHSWLGDLVDEVVKVELNQGNTMIIPTGWIHAVYTPVDTLVFGGNFLHSYNVSTQLKVRNIEIATQVPKKFRFPMFTKLCWYVGDKYLRDLKSKDDFSPRVLASIEALAQFLVGEARIIERGTDQAKRDAKEQIPSDRIKDPGSMARELRWRARQAAGYLSEEEEDARGREYVNGHTTNGVGNKRKRLRSESVDEKSLVFKNFKPRHWDKVIEETTKQETVDVVALRPTDQPEWFKDWVESEEGGGVGERAKKDERRDIVVKVRRTENGMERQRIVRVYQEWTWE